MKSICPGWYVSTGVGGASIVGAVVREYDTVATIPIAMLTLLPCRWSLVAIFLWFDKIMLIKSIIQRTGIAEGLTTEVVGGTVIGVEGTVGCDGAKLEAGGATGNTTEGVLLQQ